jgi:hypothetical protein
VGRKLDHLYKTTKLPVLELKEVDTLVDQYLNGPDKQREEALSTLLKAWHKYFMKYVEILCGSKIDIRNRDTKEFLQLFLSTEDRNPYSVVSIRNYVKTICNSLEPDDIYNQLCMIFMELLNGYQPQEGINFTRYLTKLFRWSVKSWLMEMASDPLSGVFTNIEIVEDILEHNTGQRKQLHQERLTENEPQINDGLGLELDLKWVFQEGEGIFTNLSSYERYLIYAKKFGRSKNTIHTHLKSALDKLRRIHNEHERDN